MADNLLDNQLSTRVDAAQQRVDTMRQDVEIQRQTQAELAQAEQRRREEQVRAEAVIRAAQESIPRPEQPVNGNVQIERLREMSARAQEDMRSRSTRGSAPMTFDVQSRTWVRGEAPSRSVELADQVAKTKMELGIGASGGRIEPTRVGPITVEQLSGMGPMVDRGFRERIARSPGGTMALKELDARTTSVINEVLQGDVEDSDGLIDKNKLYNRAVEVGNKLGVFSPTVAQAVKERLDEIELVRNADKREAKKLENVVKLQDMEIEQREMAGITNLQSRVAETFGKGARALAEAFPDVMMGMRGGLAPAEGRAIIKDRLAVPEDREAERRSMQTKYARNLRGDIDIDGVFASTQPVAEQTERLSNVAAQIPDLYDAAVAAGGDIETYLMDRLVTADNTSGMNDGELVEFVGQVKDLVDANVQNRLNLRQEEVMGRMTEGARNQVTSTFAKVANDFVMGSRDIHKDLFETPKWKAATDAQKEVYARQFILDEVRSSIAKSGDGDPMQGQMVELVLGEYEDAKGSGPVKDVIESFASYAMREQDVDRKRLAAEIVDRQAKIAAMPPAMQSAYNVMTFGGKAYAVPVDLFEKPMTEALNLFGERAALAGAMTLKDRLTEWEDSTYVRELMDGLSENGVIRATEGAIVRLANIVQPPPDATVKLYETNDALKRVVVESYVRFPEQDRRRVILDQALADQAAGTSADSPYSFDEYSAGIAPVLEAADIKEAAVKLNDYFDSENALKYLQDGGVVEALYNSKEGGNRGKAVAIAYVLLKEERERDLAAIAMGGKSIKGENVQGLKGMLDNVYMNTQTGDVGPSSHESVISDLNDFAAQSDTYDYQQLLRMRDELNNFATVGNVGAIRRDVDAYSKALESYNKQFGTDANGVAKIGPSVANAYTYGADEVPGRGYQRMDMVVRRSKELLEAHNKALSAVNNRISELEFQARRTPAPIAGLREQFQ